MFGILDKLKQLLVNKYLRSIVRNVLQFTFGAIAGVLVVAGTKYGATPEDVKKVVDLLMSLKEPLEAFIVPVISGLLVAGSSLINASKK